MEELKSAFDGEKEWSLNHLAVDSEKRVAVCEEIDEHKVVRESDKHDSQFYERWRKNVTKTLICAAIVLTGFFYLQLRPQMATISSKPLNPPPRLVRYSTIPAEPATTSIALPSVATGLTVDFAVYQPVLLPGGAVDQTISNDGTRSTGIISAAPNNGTCATLLLMDHSFGQSYGAPYVGNYVPPNCSFNRVVLNFTAAVRGRQFDRLGMFYLNNTEIWRTSTEEPSTLGIQWTYVKDVSEYLSMWRHPQKLIFDLPNNIDSTYTGYYNTTLVATFFQSDATAATPADMIIPITSEQGANNQGSLWMVPRDNATSTVGFPRNANRAVFSVSACGQADEEFWWGNVLSSDINTFNATGAGTLFGGSAWREVQILIDGQLAGVQWPFPVIFTGGILPTLWRPIVGMDAFDLREHEIDITPWLPLLCDGNHHSFEIRVASLAEDSSGIVSVNETSGSSWYVNGKIFVWLDEAGSITTGNQLTHRTPGPDIYVYQEVTENATGFNESLINQVSVQRSISIFSTVATKAGNTSCSWTQTLSFTNNGSITNQGNVQVNYQMTQGTDEIAGPNNMRFDYGYPLFVNTTTTTSPSNNNTSTSRYDAAVNRGINLRTQGTPLHPTGLEPFSVIPATSSIIANSEGSTLLTNSTSTASLTTINSIGGGSIQIVGGYETEQNFGFGSLSRGGAMGGSESTGLYEREVRAVNGSVVRNREVVAGRVVSDFNNVSVPISLIQGEGSGGLNGLMRVKQGGLRGVWEVVLGLGGLAAIIWKPTVYG